MHRITPSQVELNSWNHQTTHENKFRYNRNRFAISLITFTSVIRNTYNQNKKVWRNRYTKGKYDSIKHERNKCPEPSRELFWAFLAFLLTYLSFIVIPRENYNNWEIGKPRCSYLYILHVFIGMGKCLYTSMDYHEALGRKPA